MFNFDSMLLCMQFMGLITLTSWQSHRLQLHLCSYFPIHTIGHAVTYAYTIIIILLLLLLFYVIEKDSNDPLAEWILTDVADKTQRGTSKRIREKMTRLSEFTHEVTKNQQEAERGREEAERRMAQMSLEERGGEGERHWLLQRGEIHITNQKLGQGGWAKVKVAEFRGERVAAKVLYKDLQSSYYHDVFAREMNMASRCRHPNLVQFIGASMDEEMVILMELMPTSLRQHLTSNAPAIPSAAFRISVSLDVAKALNYLHLMQPHPIIHRDISSANVLLEPLPNQKWRAKVTDYGSVNLQNQLQTENPGNPVYSAPEARIPSRQSTKMDIFSYGVLLVEMCTARFPDVDKRAAMIRSIRERHWVDMIHQCLQQDSRQRPMASEIITQLKSWL